MLPNQQQTEECPGCGVRLPPLGLPGLERLHASWECWSLYGELAAYHLERNDATFALQIAVDAYTAQHAGGPSRPIGTAFALIGIYLVDQHGYTGREVQRVHMQLGKRKHSFVLPEFDAPDQQGTITVADVLQVAAGAERDQRVREWSRAVWSRWQEYHDWTTTFCADHVL